MHNLHRVFAQILLAAPVGCGGIAIVDGVWADAGGDARDDAGADGAVADAPGLQDAAVCVTAPYVARAATCGSRSPTASVYVHPCGFPNGITLYDGVTEEECATVCKELWGLRPRGAQCSEYTLDDLPGPAVNCPVCAPAGVGRRPAGFVLGPAVTSSPVGEWLSAVAALERASVDAFQILRRELRHHGAPVTLIAESYGAEADEVRHARVMAALAEREGGRVEEVKVARGPIRSLEAIATENAIEGCVRETYGALVAGWQAKHASRGDIRRIMQRIAFDETEHATLAHRVHEWLMTQLDPAACNRVQTALDKEMDQLISQSHRESDPRVVDELGVPDARVATHLARRLREQLRSVTAAAAA